MLSFLILSINQAFASETCQTNQVILYSPKQTLTLGQDYEEMSLEYSVDLFDPYGRKQQSLIYDGATLDSKFKSSGAYYKVGENYTIDTGKLVSILPNMNDLLTNGWFLQVSYGYYWESSELQSKTSCYLTVQTSGVESLLIKQYGNQIKRELAEKKYTLCSGSVATLTGPTKIWDFPDDMYVFNQWLDEEVHINASLINSLNLVTTTPEGISVFNKQHLEKLSSWNKDESIFMFVGHDKAGCGFYCAYSPNQKLRNELDSKLGSWFDQCNRGIYESSLNNLGK